MLWTIMHRASNGNRFYRMSADDIRRHVGLPGKSIRRDISPDCWTSKQSFASQLTKADAREYALEIATRLQSNNILIVSDTGTVQEI